MTPGPPQKRKCKGSTRGRPCGAWAVRGAMVCKSHGGMAPQVQAKARVRAELMAWGLDAPTVDPGQTLLRLVSQSAARAEAYAAELFALIDGDDTGQLKAALVGDIWITGEDGKGHKAGEYVRALALLEAQERDRCANFCRIAIAAGLAERQVRIAEQQGQLLAGILREIIGDAELGLSTEQRTVLPAVIRRHVQELTA